MIRLNNIKKNAEPLDISFKKDVDIVYSDLSLDLKTAYTNKNQLNQKLNKKDLVLSYNEDAIRNSLITLFSTLPGQKILNPEYGLNLAQFLFYPVNEYYAETIAETIMVSISLYEPRITLTKIDITPNSEDSSYTIEIHYTMPIFSTTNMNKPFSFLGKLTQSGFAIDM